jgi:hypothetical protein
MTRINTTTVASRAIAPEDILPGTYVMVLHEVRELLYPVNPCEGDMSPALARLRMLPCETELPRMVIAVNLPFVVVKNHERKTEILDVRAVRVAKVSKRFAKLAVHPHLSSSEDSEDKLDLDESSEN